jgi:hypothetical protein
MVNKRVVGRWTLEENLRCKADVSLATNVRNECSMYVSDASDK